jgi:ABC-type cobalamin transport system permease subunit
VANDFRSRILAPVLIPVLIVVVMGAFVGGVAALLLFNTKTGALAFAAVAAGGILFAVSLAAGRERLDTRASLPCSHSRSAWVSRPACSATWPTRTG